VGPSDSTPGNRDNTRILELDGLRGLAVLMVVLWHYVGAIIDPSLGAWAATLAQSLVLGRTGVDLFFVLSGFLITGIVLDRTQQARRFLGAFYVRRALRILPPYLLLVGVFWVVVAAGVSNHAFNAETPLWRHLTFTQNLWMAEHGRWGPGAISVTWSVAIEEQFYLFFPPLLLLLPRRCVPTVLLSLAAASIVYRFLSYDGPSTAFTAYVTTPARLDALSLGGLLAWAWRDAGSRSWLQANKRVPYALAAIGAVLLPALAFFIARDLGWHMFYWGHTYLSVFFVAALTTVLLARDTTLGGILRGRWLRFAGGISYSVYLFHPLVLSCAFLLAARTEQIRNVSDALIVVAALAVTVAFCWLSSRRVEGPAIRFGRRLAY